VNGPQRKKKSLSTSSSSASFFFFFFSPKKKRENVFFFFTFFLMSMLCVRRGRNSRDLLAVGLRLALFTSVSWVATAQTRGEIACATAGAVASFWVTIATKRICSGWALNQTAVRSAESIVTLAAIVVLCVPGRVVLCSDILCGIVWNVVAGHLFQTLARAVSRALVGASWAATSFTPESIVASALTGFTITSSLTRALDELLVVIVSLWGGSPCVSWWACTKRAVGAGPCGLVCKRRVRCWVRRRAGRGGVTIVVRFTTSEAIASVLEERKKYWWKTVWWNKTRVEKRKEWVDDDAKDNAVGVVPIGKRSDKKNQLSFFYIFFILFHRSARNKNSLVF